MRKRWTAKTEITDSLLEFREKRKWQIALRRYVLEQKAGSSSYAPYFGIDIKGFRQWIESQFDETLTWDNFSDSWQFEHILPVNYFSFSDENDLKLCWNFINIRVDKTTDQDSPGRQIKPDLIGARAYFLRLYELTGYAICDSLVNKISEIEAKQLQHIQPAITFLLENSEILQALPSFDVYAYAKLNDGISFKEVMAEQALFKKFGNS